MAKSKLAVSTRIESRILTLRGEKVMLDADLASVYGVSTKALNQAAKRNAERFPEDFRFRLTAREFAPLRSQIVTSKFRRGGLRRLPWAFTEHGAIMAATVLNSPRAGKEGPVKLNVRAVALACGVLWGLGLFLVTLWIVLLDGATGETTFIGRVYRGYSLSVAGSLVGLVWGFADGLIGGAIFGWLYNWLTDRLPGRTAEAKPAWRARRSPGADPPGPGAASPGVPRPRAS